MYSIVAEIACCFSVSILPFLKHRIPDSKLALAIQNKGSQTPLQLSMVM